MERLPADMAEADPYIVVVLIGQNNAWNTLGGGAGRPSLIEALLLRSRVCRFLRLLGGSDASQRNERPGDSAVELREASWSFLKRGRSDLALSYAARAAQLDPSSVENDDLLGTIHLERLDHEKAEPFLRSAARRDRGSQADLRLARLLLHKKDMTPFFATIRRVLKNEPASEQAHLLLARAHGMTGRRDRQEAALRDGLRLSPASERLLFHLVLLYIRQGELDKLKALIDEEPSIRRHPRYEALLALRELSAPSELPALIDRVRERDLRDIGAFVQRSGARLILCDYPYEQSPWVSGAAARLNVPPVRFDEAFTRECPHPEDCIAEDNSHPNTRGYKAMADTLADEILAMAPALPKK